MPHKPIITTAGQAEVGVDPTGPLNALVDPNPIGCEDGSLN